MLDECAAEFKKSTTSHLNSSPCLALSKISSRYSSRRTQSVKASQQPSQLLSIEMAANSNGGWLGLNKTWRECVQGVR